MKSETLHILNGDATLAVFNKASIAGDTLIWREILAEGPVSKTHLWEIREKWICDTFGESRENFNKKVITEFERLNNLSHYKEILLWFEYDLVCQINLIFILSSLNGTNIPVYLICPNKIEGLPNFRGLGELSPTQLQQLLPSKIWLQPQDFNMAASAWDIYVENDPVKITTFINNDFGNLGLLKKAFQAHLSRFAKSNGLNYIDEVLLSLLEKGITLKSDIYTAFWAKESIFGMTDLQLDLTLVKLKEKGIITQLTTTHARR